MKRPAAPLSFAVLVLLAVAAMILQTGSVPHLHGGAQAGIYNQEHDLTLLAGLAGHGLPTDATPATGRASRSKKRLPGSSTNTRHSIAPGRTSCRRCFRSRPTRPT